MINPFQIYAELIRKFNPTLNLISPNDLIHLESRHIEEGICSFRIFMDIYDQSTDYSIYDLGSGNGIPGIIWAILNPSKIHYLVEIDQRKSEFLKHAIRQLNLSNAVVLNTDFKNITYRPNDVFVARAFMNLNKLLCPDYSLISQVGFLIKGSTWNHELDGLNDIDLVEHKYKVGENVERSLLHYKPRHKAEIA